MILKVCHMSLKPGTRLLVRPHLSFRPMHKGTFDHIHKGGDIVYIEDGAPNVMRRCRSIEVLAVFTPEAERLIKL